jgi:hypothetical protein
MRTRGDCQSAVIQDDWGRRLAMKNGVDSGRRKKTELAMIHEAEGLKKLTKKTQSKTVSDEAEIDSIDSPICPCGTHMLMTFCHGHAVVLCDPKGLRERTEARR